MHRKCEDCKCEDCVADADASAKGLKLVYKESKCNKWKLTSPYCIQV